MHLLGLPWTSCSYQSHHNLLLTRRSSTGPLRGRVWWAWLAHMDVYGTSVADIKGVECGGVVSEDTPLVNELHRTMLGNFSMEMSPKSIVESVQL